MDDTLDEAQFFAQLDDVQALFIAHRLGAAVCIEAYGTPGLWAK